MTCNLTDGSATTDWWYTSRSSIKKPKWVYRRAKVQIKASPQRCALATTLSIPPSLGGTWALPNMMVYNRRDASARDFDPSFFFGFLYIIHLLCSDAPAPKGKRAFLYRHACYFTRVVTCNFFLCTCSENPFLRYWSLFVYHHIGVWQRRRRQSATNVVRWRGAFFFFLFISRRKCTCAIYFASRSIFIIAQSSDHTQL